ncbi:MAG: hypothetical protein IJ228_11005 [Succinivibrio sp.]|nr:hypothetical protein [Succinivibrio sp.]
MQVNLSGEELKLLTETLGAIYRHCKATCDHEEDLTRYHFKRKFEEYRSLIITLEGYRSQEAVDTFIKEHRKE